MNFKPLVPFATLILALCLGAGCSTPNVRPFADATAEVHSAVRLSYRKTLSLMDGYEAVDPAGEPIARSSTNHPANRFTNGWALRLQAIDAMVSYSESLVNIVHSGETSKANAKAISDEVASLVEATPWGVYGDAANSIFQQVHGLAVSVAQYRSIAQAVNKADEAVQRSAEALGKDLGSLGRMLGPLYDDQQLGIIKKYNNHRGYVSAVSASRTTFEKKLLQVRAATDIKRLELLEARLAGRPLAELNALVGQLHEAEASQMLAGEALKECDDLLARVSETEQAFQAEMKTSRELRQASMELVAATREAVRVWAAAHKDLKAAIAENREPNVRLLVASALEIRETIQKLKTHE